MARRCEHADGRARTRAIVDDISRDGAAARQSADHFLGSGAILRNRDGYVERLKKGLSRVDVGASFLKTVQERPSGRGEGGVEFVARMVSRDLEDDGCSLCCLLVKMSGRQAPRRGWRQWPQLPILGVNTHFVVPREVRASSATKHTMRNRAVGVLIF
jgi:hypothetical protein